MNEWFVKIILHPSKHITLIVLLNYLKKVSFLAEQNDRMPIVEIVLDGQSYLLVKEKDFTERFGE